MSEENSKRGSLDMSRDEHLGAALWKTIDSWNEGNRFSEVRCCMLRCCTSCLGKKQPEDPVLVRDVVDLILRLLNREDAKIPSEKYYPLLEESIARKTFTPFSQFNPAPPPMRPTNIDPGQSRFSIGGSTLHNCFIKALNEFPDHGLFTLFLSTVSPPRPRASPTRLSGSHRVLQTSQDLLAPYTEMPFDCHESFPLSPGMNLEDVVSLDFLSRFGRPL